MAVDHIRYDILAQSALRGVVRQVLADTAKKGLPGEHHFFITFDTLAAGVRLSARMREQYPEEMTIVLQHQFWDLKVTDNSFEVGLSFGGVAEKLLVPFEAIKSFFDPSTQFGLQFETLAEGAQPVATPSKVDKRDDKSKSKPRLPARQEAATADKPPATTPGKPDQPPKSADKGAAPKPPGGEIVQLDRFRKK